MIKRIILHTAKSIHSIQYKHCSCNSSYFLTDSEAVCSNTARQLQQRSSHGPGVSSASLKTSQVSVRCWWTMRKWRSLETFLEILSYFNKHQHSRTKANLVIISMHASYPYPFVSFPNEWLLKTEGAGRGRRGKSWVLPAAKPSVTVRMVLVIC